jgi:hypothetical protein
MNKKIAIGHHDFESLIQKELYYVDKTLFIQKLVENKSVVFLFPRPRRFGKTLNMMMLRRFFEISEKSKAHLFDGLKIRDWQDFEKYQGKYPVIWLSMKDIKFSDWQTTRKEIIGLIQEEFLRHSYLLESNSVSENLKEYFNNVSSTIGDDGDFVVAIRKLSEMLFLHYSTKPIILIDEYDTPINNAFTQNFYDDCIGFLRLLYSNCLKDNDYVERAVLTGIFRVAKESIFSGLNNLKVSTILDDEFAEDFGFTPDEVHQLLSDYNALDYEEEVKRWYNGYLFGAGKVIYNPWSILNFAANSQRELMPYWVNTSSNDIIKELILNSSADVKRDIETLLRGETILKMINEDVVFGNINQSLDAIWNFFLFSGYLKLIKKEFINGDLHGHFAIPNQELLSIFRTSVMHWFVKSETYDRFKVVMENMKKGQLKDFSKYFADFIKNACSYYDFADKEPEKIYHALVLGMMVHLQSDYRISSNRESGYGRYDIVLHPLKQELPGFVFEFKKFDEEDEESIQQTLDSAFQQMLEKEYANILVQEGCERIHHIAIAFKGKEVKMRYV